MLRFSKYILILLISLNAIAQVGSWENIPTLTEIHSLLPLDNNVLIASNGGILNFDTSLEKFEYGIAGQQTENLDVQALYLASDSLLWLGSRSPGPVVEVVDLTNGVWKPVEFIDLDEVNSFLQVGDSTYATYKDGLDGGILLYRKTASQIEYLDIFNNFPAELALDLTTVNDVLFRDGKLVLRTNKTLLWVELDGSNLKDPNNWSGRSLSASTPDISRLINTESGLVLAAGNSLFSFDFTEFTELVSASSPVVDLKSDHSQENVVIIATENGVSQYDIEANQLLELMIKSGIKGLGINAGFIWTANESDFLAVIEEGIYKAYSANRPADHFFNKITVNSQGQLIGGAKNGISIYSGEGWQTIRAGNSNSAFDENSYNWNEMISETLDFNGGAVVEDMLVAENDIIYISLQGKGVLKFDQNQPTQSEFFNTTDGVLEPTFNSDVFILPGQMAIDSKANTWIPTKYVQDGGNVLTILDSGGEVFHIDQYLDGLSTRTIWDVAIDENDFVWTGSQVVSDLQANGGLSMINYNKTLSNPMEIDASSLLGGALGSNDILQLEIDSHNVLWILTPSGVQSMPLPSQWLNSSELRSWASLNMTSTENDFWQLTDYNVTGIEIDHRGNHWFLSSNAGVHVLLENGRWVNGGIGYNTGNSGLIDNEIYSAAFDQESGQAYFSTPKGISVLNTAFAEPKENFSNIHIYPQPFNPGFHDRVVIQGLMDKSSVKILTVAGNMVRELNAADNTVQGHEAQWDGRDTKGDLVGSGVYILYLFNEDGEAASQKLAVLN